MKKQSLSILLAAALALPGLVLTTSTVSAQDAGQAEARPGRGGGCEHGDRGRHGHGRRGHRDPEQRLARMTEALGLDANQVTLIRQAFEQARAEHEALRNQPRSEELRAQHRAIMERTRERIDAVLTPEQRAIADQHRAERRQRMEERMERRGQRRGGERGQGGGPGRGGVDRGGVDPRGI